MGGHVRVRSSAEGQGPHRRVRHLEDGQFSRDAGRRGSRRLIKSTMPGSPPGWPFLCAWVLTCARARCVFFSFPFLLLAEASLGVCCAYDSASPPCGGNLSQALFPKQRV